MRKKATLTNVYDKVKQIETDLHTLSMDIKSLNLDVLGKTIEELNAQIKNGIPLRLKTLGEL